MQVNLRAGLTLYYKIGAIELVQLENLKIPDNLSLPHFI